MEERKVIMKEMKIIINVAKLMMGLLPIAIGLLLPSIVLFYVLVNIGGYSIGNAFGEVLTEQFEEGTNLFFIAILTAIPFLILSLVVIYQMFVYSIRRAMVFNVLGLSVLVSFIVPVYYFNWKDLYAGEHVSSTSCLIFLFVPIYACIALFFSLMIGWSIIFVVDKYWFKKNVKINILPIIPVIMVLLSFLNFGVPFLDKLLWLIAVVTSIVFIVKLKRKKENWQKYLCYIITLFLCFINLAWSAYCFFAAYH
jgi:hypothetical protein